MARTEEWEKELEQARKREVWSISGPTRLVKVFAGSSKFTPTAATGFIGMEKALVGKTPLEIEGCLGLELGSSESGYRIYRLLRLPLAHEVDYELTAKYPDGQFFNAAMHSALYLPGNDSAHQWQLKGPIPIAHLIDLSKRQRYPSGLA